jgi:hypothetical protein
VRKQYAALIATNNTISYYIAAAHIAEEMYENSF